jgi:hypothetical protein
VIIATGTHWTAASAFPAALAKDQRCGQALTASAALRRHRIHQRTYIARARPLVEAEQDAQLMLIVRLAYVAASNGLSVTGFTEPGGAASARRRVRGLAQPLDQRSHVQPLRTFPRCELTV